MEITVVLKPSQELIQALTAIASAFSGQAQSQAQVTATVQQAPSTQPAPAPVTVQQPQYDPTMLAAPGTQYQLPIQAPIQQPVQQPQPQPPVAAPPMSGVPTSVQTYSMEQIAVAATQLVDAGRMNEVVSLLASFGVQALTELPKEHYGAFATQLRAMGAKL